MSEKGSHSDVFTVGPLFSFTHTPSHFLLGVVDMLLALLFLMSYLSLSVLLSWRDIRTGLLPDCYTCPLLWLGLLYHLVCMPSLLPDAVWGAAGGYLAFAAIYWGYFFLRRREGLGYGDIKLLAALGAWHGWQALPQLAFIAALLGSCFVLTLFVAKRSTQALKNPLRFGPFLATAGLITECLNIQSTVNLLAL